MKAIVREMYGGPEVIQIKELDKPTPKKNELLIKVHKVSINRTDCGVLTGLPKVFRLFIGIGKPKRIILGTDFAGEVVAVGPQVKKFKIGDRVFGLNDEGLGSYAEYLCYSEDKGVIKIPDNISYSEAAASAEGPHYAINFLNKFKLRKDASFFINGATGGIGSASLQLLVADGHQVDVTANSKNLDRIKSLGANNVINYEKEDFTEVATKKYDFILDSVGKSSFGACKKIMAKGGIYVSSELGPGNENLYLPIATLFSNKKVKFPFPSNPKKSLEIVSKLLGEGKYKPIIDKEVSPDEVQEAFAYVAAGKKTGNVILDISGL